ncbi:hypothetical protein WKW80_05190 [Variovorax humicola]|uniref:Uncharacterized protein n=1 Tax=Variovorax humicola TaxID=1769758 RepID=A0ABU8VUS3_9BURK
MHSSIPSTHPATIVLVLEYLRAPGTRYSGPRDIPKMPNGTPFDDRLATLQDFCDEVEFSMTCDERLAIRSAEDAYTAAYAGVNSAMPKLERVGLAFERAIERAGHVRAIAAQSGARRALD